MIVSETKKLLEQLIDLQFIKNNRHRRYSKAIVPAIGLILVFLLWSSVALGLVLNDSRYLSEEPFSFSIIVGYPVIPLIHWHMIINYERFRTILDEMQGIARKATMDPIPRKMLYEKAQRRGRAWLQICAIALDTVPIVFGTPLIYVAYRVCSGDYTENSWIFFFSVWTPFQPSTTFRCAVLAIFQFLPTIYNYLAFRLAFSAIIESILYIKTFIADVKLLLNEVDRLATNGESEAPLLELCKTAIEMHCQVYECVDRLAPLMNPIFTILLPPGVLAISFSLLAIETNMHEMSIQDLQLPMFVVLAGLLVLFFVFKTGQILHSDLAELNDHVYQLQWQRYPRSVQRFVFMMMMRAQKPYYLVACGLFQINLETYVGVVKFIYSTFMLFRSVK